MGPISKAPSPDPPSEDASPQVRMADKLKTAVGRAIYRARTFTVEPVLGIITEVGRAQDKGRVAAGTEGRFHASTRRCAWTHGFGPSSPSAEVLTVAVRSIKGCQLSVVALTDY